MKILFLCHKMPFPVHDGGAIATLNMIEGFSHEGDEVTVLAMQTHKHAFPLAKLPEALTRNIHWEQVWVNTKLHPVKAALNLLFSQKPYNAVRFHSRPFKQRLQRLLRENTYDIIQLEGIYLDAYIPTIRKHSAAKIALRAHNVEHEIWQRLAQNESSVLKKFYLSLLARRIKKMEFQVLKHIDLLIPITHRDAAVLKIDRPAQVMVSSTGMVASKFKQGTPAHKKSLFYIGALDWVPNQEGLRWFLNNVWADVAADFPDWEFVIAGRKAPQRFVKELHAFRVNYVGAVESATDFMDTYNIMVVPLLSGSGMRIKIIEGMARAKCIITTALGAEGIFAEHKKEIFIQDTPDDFKQVLKNLFQNQDQIEKCGENAFIFVQQNYNNSIIINKLRDFYTKHKDIT